MRKLSVLILALSLCPAIVSAQCVSKTLQFRLNHLNTKMQSNNTPRMQSKIYCDDDTVVTEIVATVRNVQEKEKLQALSHDTERQRQQCMSGQKFQQDGIKNVRHRVLDHNGNVLFDGTMALNQCP